MSGKHRYIVDQEGKRQEVVLPLDEYEDLLEDLHDLAVVAERREDVSIPWSEVRERLKRDGILPG